MRQNNQNKREYRSPAVSKSQQRTASKRREQDFEKVKEKEREKCMQERLALQDDAKKNSSANPEDELLFKMMDGLMFL